MVDWAATGSMLSGIGTIGGAVALVVAAALGRRAIKDIRHEKITEREINYAERALTSAYKLANAISSIRSPITTGFETQQSRQELEETDWFANLDSESKERTVYSNIFYQRIRSYQDDFNEASLLLPSLKAFFGSETQNALREMIHARHIVRVYADAYIRDRGQNPDHSRTIERHIWEGALPDEIDPIASTCNSSVSKLEEVLLPIIRSDAKLTARPSV